MDDLFDFDAENFDAENFDTEDFSGRKPAPASKTGLSQLTLVLANATANALTAQVFGGTFGIAAMIADTLLYPTFNPATPEQQLGLANLNSKFYFDKDGTLVVQDAAGAKLTVKCNELSYRALLNYIATGSGFVIKRLRYNATSDTMFGAPIFLKERTMLGRTTQDSVNPNQYYSPDQMQTKIVDMPLGFKIDAAKCIEHSIPAGGTATWNFQISSVAKNYRG